MFDSQFVNENYDKYYQLVVNSFDKSDEEEYYETVFNFDNYVIHDTVNNEFEVELDTNTFKYIYNGNNYEEYEDIIKNNQEVKNKVFEAIVNCLK
jgi:hypothetical protein